MATIGRDLWDRYSGSLDDAARKAASFVSRSIRAFVAANPGASVADVRRAGEDALRAACDDYGLQAAELAALMYDEVARICGIEGEVDPAEPSDDSIFEEEAAKVAHYQAGKLAAGDTAGFIAQMGDAAADQVLDRANRTFIENASRPVDKAAGVRFARVLTGLENCTFCTMLASRGFVYSTWDNAYQTGRRHRNCDCRVVSGTPGTELEGYDLDAVTEQWQAYEEIDARTHEDGAPWTAEEKRAAKSEWSREHPVWREGQSKGARMKPLRTTDDPAADEYGSLLDTNRLMLYKIVDGLEARGVEVRVHSKEFLGYVPSSKGGVPGQLHIWPGASYSAVAHEVRHYWDDFETGFLSYEPLIADGYNRIEWERHAYQVEIDLAKAKGNKLLADALQSLLDKEIGQIKHDYGY